MIRILHGTGIHCVTVSDLEDFIMLLRHLRGGVECSVYFPDPELDLYPDPRQVSQKAIYSGLGNDDYSHYETFLFSNVKSIKQSFNINILIWSRS
jgi:hypothetical protein